MQMKNGTGDLPSVGVGLRDIVEPSSGEREGGVGKANAGRVWLFFFPYLLSSSVKDPSTTFGGPPSALWVFPRAFSAKGRLLALPSDHRRGGLPSDLPAPIIERGIMLGHGDLLSVGFRVGSQNEQRGPHGQQTAGGKQQNGFVCIAFGS
ncbi:MAG: hypothetical protein IJF79_03950, partial [Clostridia bacterium]|nr:hypothetical protein [Clostridia bacterium]